MKATKGRQPYRMIQACLLITRVDECMLLAVVPVLLLLLLLLPLLQKLQELHRTQLAKPAHSSSA
jgi:hypothetical protein